MACRVTKQRTCHGVCRGKVRRNKLVKMLAVLEVGQLWRAANGQGRIISWITPHHAWDRLSPRVRYEVAGSPGSRGEMFVESFATWVKQNDAKIIRGTFRARVNW